MEQTSHGRGFLLAPNDRDEGADEKALLAAQRRWEATPWNGIVRGTARQRARR